MKFNRVKQRGTQYFSLWVGGGADSDSVCNLCLILEFML
jgi:hypothetical protein